MKNLLNLTIIILLVTVGLQGCTNPRNQDKASTQEADYAMEASEVTPVLTGTKIPDATLRNTEGEKVQLRDITSRQPTVIIFYRGGWCPYCNEHMAELQRIEQKIVDKGYQIIAISPDRPELLKESIQKHDLNYTLYSDSPMEAAKAFGLAFRLDDKTLNRYREMDLDLQKRSGQDHQLLPVPAVFLVNRNGKISFKYANPDYKTRIDSKVLLAAVEAYYPAKEGTN